MFTLCEKSFLFPPPLLIDSLLLKYWLFLSIHRIQLGAATHELYVDGKWYGCIFGGPSIVTEIGGKKHIVKMEGPPPDVKIGMKRLAR
jgi:hypothetical protein